MDNKTIENFLDRLPGVKALVIGDLILDEYLWGDSDRISPEAPVPIVDVMEKELRLGGAGNVISNLLDLGCVVDVAGVVGDDENGGLLLHLLSERNVSTVGLVTVSGRITSRKTRVLANRQQMLRIDNECRDTLSAEIEIRLIESIQSRISDYDVLFVSDYLKGVMTERVSKAVILAGRTAGIPIVVDPKGKDYRKYAGATLITPNRKEAELATGSLLRDETALIEGGSRLRSELSLDALLLTRSAEGMSLFTAGEVVHVPTRAREVFDVSGAGDTVLALVGAALAVGLSLVDAAKMANVGAGIVVGKLGTSTVTAAEIAQVLMSEQGSSKLCDRQTLFDSLQANRRGKQVVFTNGCFDLLHVGHVKYLQKSRQLGDILIVGLNSDRSVRQLKGPSRPLISEEERAHILAALDCVDYVTIFDEETPLELIRLITPDILVKGGDYSLDGVVGREEVERHGGRVELVQFVDGKSTTNMIEKNSFAVQGVVRVLTARKLMPAVFLDRDGTINIEKHYLHKIEDFEFIPGAPEAILRLNRAGYRVVIVTNQSGVARGYYSLEAVALLHAQLQECLNEIGAVVDGFYVCPHHPTTGVCDCRKGKPGMLLHAARDLDLDLAASIIVGDKLSDIEAGIAAGCTPLLVLTGYGLDAASKVPDRIERFVDLPAAVDYIVEFKQLHGVI